VTARAEPAASWRRRRAGRRWDVGTGLADVRLRSSASSAG